MGGEKKKVSYQVGFPPLRPEKRAELEKQFTLGNYTSHLFKLSIYFQQDYYACCYRNHYVQDFVMGLRFVLTFVYFQDW